MTSFEKKYDQLMVRIAGNLKKIRKERGLTQEDMRDLGFDYRFYQRLESGQYSPSLQTLLKVAVGLKIDVSELLDP